MSQLLLGDLRHNHNKKLALLIGEGRIKTSPINVRHNDDCRVWSKGGFCNCEPDIVQDGKSLVVYGKPKERE